MVNIIPRVVTVTCSKGHEEARVVSYGAKVGDTLHCDVCFHEWAAAQFPATVREVRDVDVLNPLLGVPSASK